MVAARGMVTPLAITTGIPKLTRYVPAFGEWSETGTATAPVASTRDEDTSPLNQDGIDVRWTMCHNLGRSDCPRHVRNGLARHGNHPQLDSIMTQRGKLITCNLKLQVKADWTGVLGCLDSSMEDESPRTMSASISITQHRTRGYSHCSCGCGCGSGGGCLHVYISLSQLKREVPGQPSMAYQGCQH